MMKKSMKITIKVSDVNVAIGHRQHLSGIGAHKNHRQDKKTRRREDRRSAQNW